jgi:hypothetical protein
MKNLWHCSAFTLLGWMLMYPPIGVRQTRAATPGQLSQWQEDVDVHAPLAEWQVQGHFNTAEECAEYRLKSVREYETYNANRPLSEKVQLHIGLADSMIRNSVCVSADDPKVRGK